MNDYVLDVGGSRLKGHRRFVRKCCDWVAEEGPPSLDREIIQEIIRRRAGQEYGSVMLLIVLPMLINIISGLLMEWWKRRNGTWNLTRFDAP